MSAPRSAATKANRQLLEQARALDLRRQAQIINQVDTINRLMQGGTYDEEMRALHEELASTQMELADARLELDKLRGN